MKPLENKTGFKRKERIIALCTLLPIFLYHLVFILLPSLQTIFNSFTDWNGLQSKEFIGLNNFAELLQDPNFAEAITNNMRWMMLFLTVPIVISIIMGYVLSHARKGRIFFRACYFLPYVISAAIAGKIFAAFFNPFIGINALFEQWGAHWLIRDWLAPDHSLVSVAFVDMWHWWGFLLVIFMGALQQIDPMLYESAEVEGANEAQKIWHITLPSIKRTLIFIILVTMVWSISTFEYVWVMTKGSPGSSLLSTMLYKNALFKYRAGYASAISLVQGILAVIIFGVFGIVQRRLED